MWPVDVYSSDSNKRAAQAIKPRLAGCCCYEIVTSPSYEEVLPMTCCLPVLQGQVKRRLGKLTGLPRITQLGRVSRQV